MPHQKRNKGNKPKVPKEVNWLTADPIWQQAVGGMGLNYALGKGLQKGEGGDILTAFGNYKDTAARARTRTNEDFTSGMNAMRLQKSRDINDMTSDYAARGLGTSGLQFNAKQNYLGDFREQARLAGQAKTRGLTDIKTDVENQRFLSRQQINNAYQNALLRRMQRKGLTAPPTNPGA